MAPLLQAFTVPVIEWVFLEKIGTVDFSTLSSAGFDMFEYYYKYVNWKRGQFEQPNERQYIVKAIELLGTERLWRIAFSVVSTDVGAKAISFLVKLYLNVLFACLLGTQTAFCLSARSLTL